MAINEEGRQRELVAELEDLARSVTHSTRRIPDVQDLYGMLGDLRATLDHIAQTLRQFAAWRSREAGGPQRVDALEGRTEEVRELRLAAEGVSRAASVLGRAHEARGCSPEDAETGRLR